MHTGITQERFKRLGGIIGGLPTAEGFVVHP